MATEVKLPDLGENIESGQVVNVFVLEGETIAADQPMIEIETDKATIEVPSSVGGKVTKVHVKASEKVKVGQVILTVEERAEAPPKEARPEEPPRKEEPAPPKAGEKGPPSPKEEPAPVAPAEKPKMPEPAAAARVGEPIPAAPSVRRLAREIGIDIAKVPGTGPGRRISEEDVKSYSRRVNAEQEAAGPSFAGVRAEKLPDFAKWGAVEREAMSNIRRKTAEHLAYCWATVPHVHQFDKADITDLEAWRKRVSPKVEKAGGKLTITAIALKIVASALKAFPQFNSSVDMESNEIIRKKFISIGVAVDTDRGLLVPVIRDVDRKSLVELSVELTQVSEKARSKKLTLEDMQGRTFTISNLGGIGGTNFTPVVNAPEVAILGIARGAFEPVYDKERGEFKARLMLPLSLGYDHRVIDGADGARFLRWVVEAFEDPLLMIL